MKAKFQDEVYYTHSSFACAKAILKGRKEFLHVVHPEVDSTDLASRFAAF